MFKNTKSIKAIIFLAAASLFIIPSVVLAQWTTDGGPSTLTQKNLSVVLENIIIGILGLIGVLGILFLVYGGVKYVTSSGNETDIEEAKTIITYAIYGLFLVAAAYAIVTTVVGIVG